MTEHDEPTVARATLWLDSSSDTSTRRANCLEDCETLAFERQSLEPATPEVPLAPPPPAAPPAETIALDRANAFAAFEAFETSTFGAADRPAAASQATNPPRRWRSIISHGVAMAVGAASVACLLALGRSDAPSPAKRVNERPTENAAKQAAIVSSPQPASDPSQAQIQSSTDGSAALDGATDATLSGAVEALTRGDYAAAHAQYAALAAQRPHDAALATVATILADRIDARCASGGGKGTACAR